MGRGECLKDYIKRIEEEESTPSRKITYEEWWKMYAPLNFSLDDEDSFRINFKECWNAAQLNKEE